MHTFNLLPWREMRQRKHLKALAWDFSFILCVGVLITFIWMIIASQGLSTQYEHINYLKEQNDIFLKTNVQLVKLEKEKIALIGKIELLNKFAKERQQLLAVWSGLSQALPDTVYLVSIVKNKDEISLEGRAKDSKSVAQFMRALEDNPVFDRPILSNISLTGKPQAGAENTFKINVRQEGAK
ncbi:PilN domain-containing protein [Caedibacter taeniospiralis]|jgi:type IV pilus assembly protein PilN|uniref:PilN domain-containing protein n=1 Tax=Caedibacter taeniospiralis TaxID=28907 RepID=UPI0037C05322